MEGETVAVGDEARQAAGEQADLLLANCNLVNVLSGEVHPAEVAIQGGKVVGIGDEYEARDTIDLGGKYVAPGFIDAHVHIESSLMSLFQFARSVVPLGTTTVVTDCHEIANVNGLDGIRYFLDASRGIPLDVFVMLPPCVPSTELETSGARLEAEDFKPLLGDPLVLGLGELMNYPGTIARDARIMSKLKLFPRGPVEGHAPGLSGLDLSSYIAAGPESEHEATSVAEASEKLRKGMYIYLREATRARNLLDILPLVDGRNSRRFCMCTDDRDPRDLLERGHVGSMVRMAVKAGVHPVTAIQMVTINSFSRFGLFRKGAVSIGYDADIVVFDNLEEMNVSMVIKDGKIVAREGKALFPEVPEPDVESKFHVAHFGPSRLKVARGGDRLRVMGLVEDQILTNSLVMELTDRNEYVQSDVGRDLLKLAVVERHEGTGNVGIGFVKGFGLSSGAIASSVAHDSHNIIAVGSSDEDMVGAIEQVIRMRGGFAVVAGGNVLESLELPIAGLMSRKPVEEVAGKLKSLNTKAKELGCRLEDPFSVI
ncbi:MAG: adenine deaminase, partial [Actinomycetota bacterium]|nr:adenine deaminase [Actinomycetota bacterium]